MRAYGLSGTNLLAFETAAPSQTIAIPIVGITAGETLVGIDFRPQNGFLYSLGVNATANTATLYAISARTGQATAVGTAGQIAFVSGVAAPIDLPDPATSGYSFDFNPAVDRIRVTTDSGLDFRINPNSGAAVDGDFGGGAGSVAGVNPDGAINGGTTGVSGAAYTNNQPNNGNITTLYTLDPASNALYIQNPANSGTQTLVQTVTLGGNPLDFTAASGFDIPTGVNASSSNAAVASGSAFAALNVGGVTSLYSINLVNAQATLIGPVGTGTAPLQGLAVQSDPGGIRSFLLRRAEQTSSGSTRPLPEP